MKSRAVKRYTNESLSKKFDNPFFLVNHAIALAENMIRSGREPYVDIDCDNLAMIALEEIDSGKAVFVAIENNKPARQPQSSFDDEQLKKLMREERAEGRKSKEYNDRED